MNFDSPTESGALDASFPPNPPNHTADSAAVVVTVIIQFLFLAGLLFGVYWLTSHRVA